MDLDITGLLGLYHLGEKYISECGDDDKPDIELDQKAVYEAIQDKITDKIYSNLELHLYKINARNVVNVIDTNCDLKNVKVPSLEKLTSDYEGRTDLGLPELFEFYVAALKEDTEVESRRSDLVIRIANYIEKIQDASVSEEKFLKYKEQVELGNDCADMMIPYL